MEHTDDDDFYADMRAAVDEVFRKSGESCTLSFTTFTKIMEDIESLSRIDGDGSDVVEEALETNSPYTNELHQEGYRLWIRNVLRRRERAEREREDRERGRDAPFSPR